MGTDDAQPTANRDRPANTVKTSCRVLSTILNIESSLAEKFTTDKKGPEPDPLVSANRFRPRYGVDGRNRAYSTISTFFIMTRLPRSLPSMKVTSSLLPAEIRTERMLSLTESSSGLPEMIVTPSGEWRPAA